MTMYPPGSSPTVALPSESVVTSATGRRCVSSTKMVAPSTGRSSHPGWGGSRSTGQVGPVWTITASETLPAGSEEPHVIIAIAATAEPPRPVVPTMGGLPFREPA